MLGSRRKVLFVHVPQTRALLCHSAVPVQGKHMNGTQFIACRCLHITQIDCSRLTSLLRKVCTEIPVGLKFQFFQVMIAMQIYNQIYNTTGGDCCAFPLPLASTLSAKVPYVIGHWT